MYNLDLATLLQLLQEFRRTGSIYAQLPPGALALKERCQAKIELIEGKMISCWITTRNGQYSASGDEALQILHRLGTLDWEFQAQIETPQHVSETSPILSTDPSAFIPRRLASVEQTTLNRLSRKQRRVFVLVDGERSIAKIVSILFPASPNTKEVIGVLRELEAMRLITVKG